jgi:hypothetical protein
MFFAIRGWTPCNCAVVTPIEPLQAAVTGGRLLAQYAQAAGLEVKAPIRIEDIVEKHLKLRVDFDDLHRLLGVPRDGFGVEPDIFGAIWLETGEIYIDEILDPEERPSIEGRYRFTLAHEGGGQWRLHRSLVLATSGQGSLFGDMPRPTVVCRTPSKGAGGVSGRPLCFVFADAAQTSHACLAREVWK